MIINFSPVDSSTVELRTIEKTGDTLVINGEEFDFTPLLEGSVLPATAINSPNFVGDVRRKEGAIELTLVLPYVGFPGKNVTFPQAIEAEVDGPITIPGAA